MDVYFPALPARYQQSLSKTKHPEQDSFIK